MNPKVVPTCVLGMQHGYVVYERCLKVKSQGNFSKHAVFLLLISMFLLETVLTSVNSKTSIRVTNAMVH